MTCNPQACGAQGISNLLYSFEDFVLDSDRRELRRGGGAVVLQPQVFDLLEYLIRQRDRVVSKDDLIAAVWSGRIVSESALTTRINAARTAIGDSGEDQRLIRTLPRKGVRFVGVVQEDGAAPATNAGTTAPALSRVAADGTRTALPAGSDAAAHEAPPLSDRPSIAVLPFDNMSGDPQQDYFSDGIVEEIITALTRTSWLLVIARNSSFTYKGRAVDVKQVGRELGVHYVLEGSLRKSANRIRITCQLIDASNGAHIWADRYDGALEDIFDLQDQVTANLVSAIARQLQRAAIERARRKPTENLNSYDHFLRGMASSHLWNPDASNDALRHFNRAIELDPEFATAYGIAAWCYVWRIAYGWVIDPEQEYAAAVRLARRAIELGPDDAVALGCGGWVLGYVGRELDAGATFVDRARALNPGHAPTWYFSGWLRVFLGDPEAAIPHFAEIMRLSPRDPLTFHMQNGTAWAHFFADRYHDALDWAERALRESPTCKPALRISAASQAFLGRMEDARATISRMSEVDPKFRVRDLRIVAPFRRPEHLAKFEAGLRNAGLAE